jgi:hypothetical protein
VAASGQQHDAEEADNLPYRHEQESEVSRVLQMLEELDHGCGQENGTLLFWFIGDFTKRFSFKIVS